MTTYRKDIDIIVDARNIIADLLQENTELRVLLQYAHDGMEGFISYKRKTLYSPGFEYSERFERIRQMLGVARPGDNRT